MSNPFDPPPHTSGCQCYHCRGERDENRGGASMSYVYIKSEAQLWTVGFYTPDGKWNPESDHSNKESAADRTHWLNGGEEKQSEVSGSYEEYQHFKKTHPVS